MKKYNNLIFIPARSKSKRILDKNIRSLVGKPLFYFQISNALKVKGINKVVFSTDSLEYVDYVKKYFDIDFHERSTDLADDKSKTEESMLDCLRQYEDQGINFENIILLQISSPLNKSKYINDGLDLMEREKKASVASFVRDVSFFFDDQDILERPMSQDRKFRKKETGCFWITNVGQFLKKRNRLVEPIGFVEVTKEASYEIDDELDLKIVERLLTQVVYEKDNLYFKKRSNTKLDPEFYNNTIDPDGIERDMLSLEERDKKIVRCNKEIKFINNLIKNSKENLKLLDVGCGPGHVAYAINENCEKYGLETSSSACEIAKPFYKHIHCGVLEDDTYGENFFDIIFCYHTIEHVNDPISFIKRLSKIIKLNGHLIIGTPNFDSGAARLFGENYRLLNDPTHISLFDTDGLSLLLEHNGFQINKKDFPFFEEDHFNRENLMRLFDKNNVSPPFYGNIQTFYCTKK